jgi:hypothetical protein
MNKKLIAIIILGMFLLTCTTTLSAVEMKTTTSNFGGTGIKVFVGVLVNSECMPPVPHYTATVVATNTESFESYDFGHGEVPEDDTIAQSYSVYTKDLPVGTYTVKVSGIEGWKDKTRNNIVVVDGQYTREFITINEKGRERSVNHLPFQLLENNHLIFRILQKFFIL